MRFLKLCKKNAYMILLAAVLATGCGAKKDDTADSAESSNVQNEASVKAETENAGSDTEADTSEEAASEESSAVSDEIYEGTVAAKEAAQDESGYFGIMYATVLEVSGKQGDSNTVYTFKDKSDPDNCWSFSGLEIGDIETELTQGTDVVILFSGDIINDSENIEFMVVLPDGSFTMKRAEGRTVGNMMSTFSIETKQGETIQFLKDNCRMDPNVLNAESNDTVIVYYADGGEEYGNYPLRVYKGQ